MVPVHVVIRPNSNVGTPQHTPPCFGADAGFFFTSTAVQAQGLQLGRWDGDLELVADYARTDIDSRGAERSIENRQTEERLTLRNTGAYVIDPRFITFTLGGTFGLAQERSITESEGVELSDEERDMKLLGYDAYVGVLPGSAWSLDLFSNHNETSHSREFSGRVDTDITNTGATLHAKRLYIPSILSIRQTRADEESRVGDIITRRNETRNTFTYDGRRGWVDSEMALRYEFLDKSDVMRPQLDYENQTANIYYSLDFGPALNWRWNSRLRGLERTGFSEETRWHIDELLQIDHTKNLRTQYRYFFTRTQRTVGESSTHLAEFNIRHQLYESLTTQLRADATRQNLSDGEREIFAGRLSFDYTKQVPHNGRLSAGLSLYHAKQDNQFDVTEAQLLQEAHTFDTPFPRAITLDNPFVIESSVFVTRTALGSASACDTVRPLVEGVDYEPRTIGNTVEIVPLGDCAIDPTVGIGPGDTIAVDYRAEVSRDLAFTSNAWRGNISLDYRWIRPYFIHDEQTQELDSGDPEQARFLEERESDIIGVELKYDGDRARATFLVEAERLRSRDQDYDAIRGSQLLQSYILPDWRLTLTARQSTLDFTAPQARRTDILEARAVLTYSAKLSFYTEFMASWRFLEDTLVPDEEINEAAIHVRWRRGKLELAPSLRYIKRERDGSSLQDYRALMRIIRKF